MLRFDGFTFDLTRCVMLRGEEELTLRRQSFDVLRYLAEHRGKVVSKGELLDAVWTGRRVTDDSIVQCITDIRRALGDDARWIIRTVSGRGYEFMAEVVVEVVPAAGPPATPARKAAASVLGDLPASDSGPSLRQRAFVAASLLVTILAVGGWLVWQRAAPAPPPVPTMMAVASLAVLPFRAASRDPAEAVAARALSEEVVVELPRQVHGGMISLRPAVGYRGEATDLEGLGRRLGARYLVQGVVRSEGGQRAVSVRLIESETGQRVWSRVYRYAAGKRRYAAVQIAGGVGAPLLLTETRRPLPDKLEAGHLTILGFSKAGRQRNPDGNEEALALLEKALRLAPNSLPALLAYAWAEITSVWTGWAPPEQHDARLDKAQEAIERAIALAPRHAVGYLRRAQLLRARGDPHGAILASRSALRLNPHLGLAHAEMGRNKIDAGLAHEAMAHVEEALRLAPAHNFSYLWLAWAGQAAVHVGDYEKALRWLQKALRAAPRGRDRSIVPWLAVAQAGLGRANEGRALIEERVAGGRLTLALWRSQYPPGNGSLVEQRGRIEALLRRLGVPEGYVQPGARQ